MKIFLSLFFRCAITPIQEALSVGQSVSWSVDHARLENRRKCLKSYENSSRTSLMLHFIHDYIHLQIGQQTLKGLIQL